MIVKQLVLDINLFRYLISNGVIKFDPHILRPPKELPLQSNANARKGRLN